MTNKEPTYKVRKDGESLTARLIEVPQQIEITYINELGHSQRGVYRNGGEIALNVRELCRYGLIEEDKSFLPGYALAYERLGPALREQIPPEWHPALGDWLKAKK